MSLTKNKDNIKDNRYSINKNKNLNINKIANKINVTKKWKMYYTNEDNSTFEYLTNFENLFILSNKTIFFNTSILGHTLYDPFYESAALFTVNKFELCNDDGSIYTLPIKYRPTKDIIIKKNNTEFNLNDGILGIYINKYIDTTNYTPKSVTLTITIQGTITITDCDFINNDYENFIINSFNIDIN